MTVPVLAHFRNAVQSICLSVQSLGVDLTPSLLQSAADGGDVVRSCMSPMHQRLTDVSRLSLHRAMQSAPIGRSLHDLVILSLAGFPSSGDQLLRKYWDQIDLEHVTAGLPIEGKHNFWVSALTGKCKFKACTPKFVHRMQMSAGQQLIHSFLQQKGYTRASVLADSCFSDGRQLCNLTSETLCDAAYCVVHE